MRVVIVGAGGQGRIVADIVRAASGAIAGAGFVDDRARELPSEIDGLPNLGGLDRLSNIPHDGVVVAIGDNATRQLVTERLESMGERLVTVQHPFSSLSPTATIGPGSMISAGVVVTPGVRIGRGVLLNTSSCVDHDTVIGDYAHVSVGATIGASASVGARTLVGLGASIMTGRHVGADSIVGAGALVVRNLPDGVVAIGSPATITRSTR